MQEQASALKHYLIQRTDGAWCEMPAELRPAFKRQEWTLRFMLGCDVGWTGMVFALYQGKQKRLVMLAESFGHVVDVVGRGYDVRI